MESMLHVEEAILTASKKSSAGVQGKATETKWSEGKIVKRPASVVVGVVLTCIMPVVYSVVMLLLPDFRESPLMFPVLGMFVVIVFASICVIRRNAKARFVVVSMYLIALCGGTLSLIFLIPFVIPAIGIILMFSPPANKWLRKG